MPQEKMRDERKMVIRAGTSTYLAFLLIWLVPSMLVLLGAAYAPPATSVWGMFFLIVLFGLGLLIWIRRFRIEYGESRICYTALFSGSNEIDTKDIESVVSEVGIHRYSDRFLPPNRLVLNLKQGSRKKRLVINIKVFNKKNIDAFVKFLEDRSVGS